jgi:DNA-binding LytR/AlgR family response regulator
VISAATLSEAEAVIDDTAQKFDLLFTEIELGHEKESGITLGKLIEETRPSIPVLYTSERALTDGMLTLFVAPSAFLPKPYTAQELTEAVEKLFSLETYSPVGEPAGLYWPLLPRVSDVLLTCRAF